MAMRLALLWSAGGKMSNMSGIKRWTHSIPQPPSLSGSLGHTSALPQVVLPESSFPHFSSGGSLELMGVQKSKVSRHKRGLRNGPKALKSVPVIIRCKVCGRVKLPHFFCCSGNKNNTGENNGSTS